MLGLDHNNDPVLSLMSEDLKPDVRHTLSSDDADVLWSMLTSSPSAAVNTPTSLVSNPADPMAPIPGVPLGMSLLFGMGWLRPRSDGTGQGMSLAPLFSDNDSNNFVATPAPIYRMQPLNAGALHTGLFNGGFDLTDPADAQFGWESRGQVSLSGSQAELSEDPRVMSGLTRRKRALALMADPHGTHGRLSQAHNRTKCGK